MKKFIAGLLVVLSVFAFMSCTTTTYTEKTVTLKSTDGAVASSTVTISADSNADAYVFVGGAYVSVTKNPYTRTYGTLTVVKSNSSWTVNYVGGTAAGKETINVYIGTTSGATMDKSFGTIIANCEAAVSAPAPVEKKIDLTVVAGNSSNCDSDDVLVNVPHDSSNNIGVFVNGWYIGEFGDAEVEIFNENRVLAGTLNIYENVVPVGYGNEYEVYARTTLYATENGLGTITDEIYNVQLASYYVVEGNYVPKTVYDEYKINVNVLGSTIFELDNVITTSRSITEISDAKAYYKTSDGKFVEIPEEAGETMPAIGTLGFLTYGEGKITFVPSVSGVVGTANLQIYLGNGKGSEACYGSVNVIAHTLACVETPMTMTGATGAKYSYTGVLTKDIAKTDVSMHYRVATSEGYEKTTDGWTESSVKSFSEVAFNDAWGQSVGTIKATQIDGSGIVNLTVDATKSGSGSIEVVFGYVTYEDEFVAVDWLNLTATF